MDSERDERKMSQRDHTARMRELDSKSVRPMKDWEIEILERIRKQDPEDEFSSYTTDDICVAYAQEEWRCGSCRGGLWPVSDDPEGWPDLLCAGCESIYKASDTLRSFESSRAFLDSLEEDE